MKRPLPILLLLLPLAVTADGLRPFSSDGCSLFPDGTLSDNRRWLGCCIDHDLRYWAGGSFAERIDADLELERCVARLGEEAIAGLMYNGVRLGGSPFFPTPYRWGYGWPYLRGYAPLSRDERREVAEALARMEQQPAGESQ